MPLVRPGAVLAALAATGIILFAVRPALTQTAAPDYLSAAAFGSVVQQLRTELGGSAELLDLTVSASAGGNVKYRDGDGVGGFAWGPDHDGLEPVDVQLLGTLDGNVFPLARLSPHATARIAEAVRARAAEVRTMTLGLVPISGAIRWTVTGTERGRELVFTARADGSGVRELP